MSHSEIPAPSADYLETYALGCEPFADDLDGRFFYAGSALMQRLDLLTHLTRFGDSVILVSGPQGSGKTTLLSRFVAQANRQWRLCLINADEFAQFGQRLGDALGIGEITDEPQMVQNWASQSDASQLLVILIDDSQQLPADAMQTLCALLDTPLAERVRLILFGTPEAQQGIKQSLDRQERSCTAQLLEIPKLSEEETAAYLMYRLAVAGYSGESPFTATEVRAICKAAGGRPAGINRLAHEALREQQMRSRGKPRKPKTPGKRTGAAWALASVVVVVMATYMGWERLQPANPPDALPDNSGHEAGQTIPLNLPAPEAMSDPGAPPESRSLSEPDAPTAPEALPTRPAAPAPDVAEVEKAAQGPEPKPVPGPAAEPPLSAIAPPALEKTPPAAESNPDHSDGKPAAAQPSIPAVPATSRPAAPAEAVTSISAKTGTARTPAAAESAASAATATAAAPAGPESDKEPPGGPRRETWLLKQPGSQYSLQLLGTRHEQSIFDYMKQNQLDPARCAYYRGSFKGGEWYVLVYGVFPDRQAALDARTDLPARVKKERPWPRSLASVQAAIREAR
jgi:DamX protein